MHEKICEMDCIGICTVLFGQIYNAAVTEEQKQNETLVAKWMTRVKLLVFLKRTRGNNKKKQWRFCIDKKYKKKQTSCLRECLLLNYAPFCLKGTNKPLICCKKNIPMHKISKNI